MNARMNLSSRNRFWRKVILGLLFGILIVPLYGWGASPGNAAPAASASDLIAAVNQLRAANNLPPYRVSSALVAAAQAHSEYQASIGQITHTGAGGTQPIDRAIAAGYGGGATVYVSENIAGGSSLSIQGAVQMWQGDSVHLYTMLNANYQDVGAGIANADGMAYYTLVAGYVAESSSGGSTPGSNVAKPVSALPATEVAFFSVVVSTPAQDGSITHIVQQGQTLWVIAATYQIELEKLLEINNLPSDAWIFPGDELLIKAPESTPAETPITTETSTQSLIEIEIENIALPTATRQPVQTSTPAETGPDQDQLPTRNSPVAESPDLWSNLSRSIGIVPLLIIFVLIFGGSVLIALGKVFNQND
jgi:LysM repeat protein